MDSRSEPPWKKTKTNPFPSPPLSFLSLPDVLILNCLARISKSYYPKLSLVCKAFRSLIRSTELNHARFHHKTQECFFHVCLQFPDRPLPSWFTLWIKPGQIEKEKENKKKQKSTLVEVRTSSYASHEPMFLVTVGSDIYAFRQYYPRSCVMLVRKKESYLWRYGPNMTVARTNPVAYFLNGKIYVMGGCAADESANWGEVFDTKTQTWGPLTDPGAELRFSITIKKIEWNGIKGKFFVRNNENKDSVYNPKKGKWKVATKEDVTESRCMVDNVWYSCRSKSILWFDKESQEWILVKGLSSLNQSYRRGLIETVNYRGKLLILWVKSAKPRGRCPDKSICCALVSLERRSNGQVWGKVEWSNVVLTVPSSYVFLRSIVQMT